MLLAWGLLAPTGVIISRFYKAWPKWFILHKSLMILAVLIALVGVVMASLGNSAVGHGNFVSPHAFTGALVMIAAIQQPLNALVRGHPGTAEEPATVARKRWEFGHKAFGRFAVFFSFLNLTLGTFTYAPGMIGSPFDIILIVLYVFYILTMAFFVFKECNFKGAGSAESREKGDLAVQTQQRTE
jgi:hypothetical protein